MLPDRPPRSVPREPTRAVGYERPTCGPVPRNDKPLAFSRNASYRCSTARCARIGILPSSSRNFPTHRGRALTG